jgi:hypothetical protein
LTPELDAVDARVEEDGQEDLVHGFSKDGDGNQRGSLAAVYATSIRRPGFTAHRDMFGERRCF